MSMSNDDESRLRKALRLIKGVAGVSTPPAAVVKPPKKDAAIAKRLHNYRPSYWTVVGQVTCTLYKIDISPVTGETVGYYSLVVRNPYTELIETTTYLYAYRNGAMIEVKRFETRYRRG